MPPDAASTTVAASHAALPALPYAAPPARYDRMIASLHWLIAALMIAQVGFGLWASSLGRQEPPRATLFELHYSFGVMVFLLALARLGWRATHAAPPLPAKFRGWETALARANYVLLYGLMLALPVTGYVTVASRGAAMPVFGLFEIPSAFGRDQALHGAFETAHVLLFYLLAAAFAAHILGALKHHLIDRENLLQRMRVG